MRVVGRLVSPLIIATKIRKGMDTLTRPSPIEGEGIDVPSLSHRGRGNRCYPSPGGRELEGGRQRVMCLSLPILILRGANSNWHD